MYQKILVPVDGSATARSALQEAVKLAKRINAQLELVHVFEDMLYWLDEGYINYAELQESFKKSGEHMLAEAKSIVQQAGLTAEIKSLEAKDGQIAPAIVAEDNYRMAFVANCYRPLTRTPEDAMEVMGEIEAACGLKFTDIINNSNLGTETTPQTVLDSMEYMEKLSALSGLPIFATTAEKTVAEALTGKIESVLPLQLQEKYFDLPSQKPGNRPLWG